MQIIVLNKDTLLYDEFKFKCSIGKNGLTSNKIEGDKKTPTGTFGLGPVYYRKDKLFKPLTKLKKIQIKKNMGWCDDINSKFYNKLIKSKKNIGHEKLFRKDGIYDILIPIKFNTIKPKKNKGSAIFLHLTNNYKKTLGCIALKKKDMLILLKLINSKTKIKIT
jgi:L,D-peptidoglycan transpeptidase YkuD (ErfK/YbiS/YcfS/YnhG family)